jgi:hypothetical protein
MLGPFDLCFMSYALVPLRDDTQYDEIVKGLQDVIHADDQIPTCCVILQDRFHESMIRRMAGEFGASWGKVTIRQKVYDPSNTNEERAYTFYRCILNIGPDAARAC